MKTIEQRFMEYDERVKKAQRHRKPLPRSVNVPEFLSSKDIMDDCIETYHIDHVNVFSSLDARVPRALKVFIGVLIGLALFFCFLQLIACNPVLAKVQQHKTLSSAYTHQGSYVKSNSIIQKHSTIKHAPISCKVSSK